MRDNISIEPIATIRRSADGNCFVEVEEQFADALDGVEVGSELQVLYWMHGLDEEDRRIQRVHPRGDRERPKRGVFALRSPMRPNPIGVSNVRVLGVEGTRLNVSGLDGLDGSPVIDLKAARTEPDRKEIIDTWGRMHDGIVEKLEAKLGEQQLTRLLRGPIWLAGRAAASPAEDDARVIGRHIVTIEDEFGLRGEVVEDSRERFARSIHFCPWMWFRPLSCRMMSWWMEGFVVGMNRSFRYRLAELAPERAGHCAWEVFRADSDKCEGKRPT